MCKKHKIAQSQSQSSWIQVHLTSDALLMCYGVQNQLDGGVSCCFVKSLLLKLFLTRYAILKHDAYDRELWVMTQKAKNVCLHVDVFVYVKAALKRGWRILMCKLSNSCQHANKSTPAKNTKLKMTN